MTRRLLVVLAVLLGLGVAAAPSASAHAVLERTTPGDGETLPRAPTEVRLHFNESVTISARSVRVFDSKGHRVDAGLPRHDRDGATVAVSLRRHLSAGTYLVAWRVISADAHPVHGGLQFNVVHPTQVSQATLDALFSSDADRPYEVVGAILRWLAYLAALFAAGGAVFLVYTHHPSATGPGEATGRRLVRIAAGAAIPLTAAALPVQAALATGQGFRSLTQPGVLSDSLADGVGLQIAVVVAGAAALLVLSFRPLVGPRRALAWVAAAACALGFAAAGHSRSTDPVALVMVADVTHLAAGAVWFGGLALLAVVIRRRTAETTTAATDVVARFTDLATIAVVAVSLSGLVLAWREVGTLHALTSTSYGWLVVAKAALAAGIIALGARNHYRLVPALRAGGDDPERTWNRLLRTVRLEAIGLVVVLGVTGVLVNAVPARTLVQGPFTTTVPLVGGPKGSTVNGVVDPTRVGRSDLHVYLLDATGRPVDLAQDVQLQLSLPAKGIGPIARQPFKAAIGHYQLTGPTFTTPGRWHVDVLARTSRFDQARASFDVDIRP
ncbi:MAG: Copper resistance protein CopC [Acidimicrobiales bacterium]|nr:Copper resistance protein CopC [Acidimicrobiales bacterium]